MTLFAVADVDAPVFREVIQKYYGGVPDDCTLERLGEG